MLDIVIGLFGVALLLLPEDKMRVHPIGVLCMLCDTPVFPSLLAYPAFASLHRMWSPADLALTR
jgi:hypothetical protein